MADISSKFEDGKNLIKNVLDNNPYNKISIPKVSFDEFFEKFENTSDILETEEWKTIYSNYYEFDKYEQEVEIHETTEEMEQYDAKKQTIETIKCANSFAYWCLKYAKISHPMHGLIRLKLYKYQRRVIDEYSKHRFNILSKFRQGGLTTTSVAWALWRCLFQTDQRIMVVSKSDREAISAGEVAKTILNYLPAWMKPIMGKNNEHERQFEDTNSFLWCYTVEAARGKAITLLIVDEGAFITDMEKHWKAIYPTISTGGACCVISTVNGIGNWYEEHYHKSENGKGIFKIIDLDYWEHPDYNNPKWVSDQLANLGEKGFQQEILRSFLGSGETFIPTKILVELEQTTKNNNPERCLFQRYASVNKDNINQEDNEYENSALWIWKEPIDGHEYIIGTDCAEGIGENGDFSCFQIIDISTLEQVAEFYSNSIMPHVFAQILNEMGIYFNHAMVVIEQIGQGTAVVSTLQNTLMYDNLYFDESGSKQMAGLKTKKDNRPLFLENLQNRLSNGTIKINSRRLVKELRTFIFNPRSRKAEALRGKHDDAIMALCIGMYVRDTHLRNMPVGAEVPKEITQIFTSKMYEEIKREIMTGAPEDWLSIETTDHNLNPDPDDVLAAMISEKRPKNALLREFNWSLLFVFCLLFLCN